MGLVIEVAPGETIEEAYQYYDSLKEANVADDKTAIKFQGFTSLPGIYENFDEYWDSMSKIIYDGLSKQEIFDALPRGVKPKVMLENIILLNDGLEENYGQRISFDDAVEFSQNAYNEGLSNSNKSR